MLNTAKSSTPSDTTVSKQQKDVGPRVMENMIVGDIDTINEMFNAPATDTQLGVTEKKYNPESEMEAIKRGYDYSNVESRMPKQILESILNNPIDMSPLIDIQDGAAPQSVMTEDLQSRTVDIINKLEKRDRQSQINPRQEVQTVTETVATPIKETNTISNFNINELTKIIESVIDNKLQEIKPMLTESTNYGSKLNFMTIGDNFKFMDDVGNVYECTMKYIGKGRVKS